MHSGSHASLDATASPYHCPFCQPYNIAKYILKETASFRLITDHAPVIEGHLLIMPKQHYACYGTLPISLDEELQALKRETQEFLGRFYAPVVFWEHGVFRQTVFHAHLHCFPIGERPYDPALQLHERIVYTQEDIRSWYQAYGHYFYLENGERAYLFAPRMDAYLRVAQEVLWSGVAAHNGHRLWRPAQQRQKEGIPLIEATITKWRLFQDEEKEHYVNKTGTR
jgi:diadenosine tetraphosphate (Ap4A) HIT family hydrolase